tara:strand:- start:412 stop:918 length:507 start_codon:yes stop_codon:yes gene_type:complete
MVIWIIGLSASGKSTLACHVVEYLREKNRPVVLLDGDTFRQIFADDVGHDVEGRRINARRLSYLSKHLSLQGVTVVAAVLSIFPEWQKWNRENIDNYFQVWLDVDTKVLLERETKSLYKDAIAGQISNVVGIDIPFPEPYKSDFKIDNNKFVTDTKEVAMKIIKKLKL